ncbi:hypothetical protein BC567DRAFT_13147 [Phyllosticta citribraziliensis]
MASANDPTTLLSEILSRLDAIQRDNVQLTSQVDAINGRVNTLAGIKDVKDKAEEVTSNGKATAAVAQKDDTKPSESVKKISEQYDPGATEVTPRRSSVSLNKIILTSYPGQAGVDPIPMQWGHVDPAVRGPVVVSRHANTIRRRNGTSITWPLQARRVAYNVLCSYWRPRWLVLHLPCPCRGEQKPRHQS